MTKWIPKVITDEKQLDNEDIIDQICSGKIPALIIRNFYTENPCNKISEKITNFSKFNHGKFFLKKIGVFLSAYLNRKEEYFLDAEKNNQELFKIFGKKENPVKKINKTICRISKLQKIDLASEDQRSYSLGIIRIWEDGDFGQLHRDNSNFEVPDFKISKYQNQISCVLHLQAPEKGGELIVYNQAWQKPDEKFRDIGFGYKRDVLNKEECRDAIIVPNQGDLVVFNPRFFHEIRPVKGVTKRLTFGYFIGFSDLENLAESWS